MCECFDGRLSKSLVDKIINTLVETRDALLKTSMSIVVGITSDSVRVDAIEV